MTAWPLILGTVGAAATAGIFAVPAVQRFCPGSIKQDWLGHELELDHIEPDGFTVRLKRGTVMRAYRLGGMAYDTKPELEQIAIHKQRDLLLNAVTSAGVTVRVFGVKRHKAVIHPATWPSPALQEIGDAEAAQYRDSYELRWYMTFKASSVEALERADDKLHSLLGTYKPVRLTKPERVGTPCPLTGFLNFLVCGDLRDDLLPISRNISANLPAADLSFDRDTGVMLAHVPTPHHHRIVSVLKWPDLTSGYLMHTLMTLEGEIEVSQVCVPVSREMATATLSREASDPFCSADKAGQCDAVKALLKNEAASLMATQFTIVLRGTTLEAVDELVATVARTLGDRGVNFSVETRAAPVAWFNRLPDHESLHRPLKLLSGNVAALWPFESAPIGLAESQYGPQPVRSFPNGSGQAYAFQFQCTAKKKALGHYAVFAPSNSGKTTLLLHLLGGLAKFDGVRSYIFDSNEGCRYMVEVMGGRYQAFDNLALNPLDVPDTRRNRHRLGMLVRSMLGDVGHDEDVDDLLVHAAEVAFQLPIGQRTFNEIFRLTFADDTPAYKAFSRWVTDHKGREGLYSHIFNAPEDSLSSFLGDSFLTGINMNEALDDPVLGPPVVAHVANAIERIARSGDMRGFNVFIDEAANLLRNPAFCDLAKVMFREYRKFGGSVGMAFQDPGALFASGIAEAVLQNTATFFFFPNPNSGPDDYKPFNLNDEQLGFILGAPEGRKVLLVKRDASLGLNESVILDIDLSPLGNALRFYDSGPDAVNRLAKIKEKWGDEWFANV